MGESSDESFDEDIKVQVIQECEKTDNREREQVFEENLPLRNKLSLVEEEKEETNEADESMENTPVRRHLESLDEISDVVNPLQESGLISVG